MSGATTVPAARIREDRSDGATMPTPTLTPTRIASAWPCYGEDEVAAVSAVLRSGRVNALHHGTQCTAFEEGFARLCGLPHAIALANGTLALELALTAHGIGAGDEVIVSPRSFVASASCIMMVGATPVFADVDPVSQALTAGTIASVISPRTRAIILVHLGGYPADGAAIAELASAHGITLIEDCAQAHGATLGGQPVGSFGDAAAFSFCTDKIISTGGEGGMLVLRDAQAAATAWSIKDHGKDRTAAKTQAPGTGFRWLHERFGSNYRLTEMQAALGVLQLARLPAAIAARRRNAAALLDALAGCDALRLIVPGDAIGHAYYKFYAFVVPEALRPGWSRDRIVEEAWAEGLPCQSGTCPEIYRERAFTDRGIGPAQRLPIAQQLGETSLMLPVDPTLDETTCAEIGSRLRAIAVRACR